MKIHLKRNEKLFLNGAVIRLDRRGSIELMNDAQFLLENHIMQPEEAITPLRQIYFVTQTMLMDPANAHFTKYLFESYVTRLNEIVTDPVCRENISKAQILVGNLDYYGALKVLRLTFHNDKIKNTDDRNSNAKPIEKAA